MTLRLTSHRGRDGFAHFTSIGLDNDFQPRQAVIRSVMPRREAFNLPVPVLAFAESYRNVFATFVDVRVCKARESTTAKPVDDNKSGVTTLAAGNSTWLLFAGS